jgi:hypothetical protein
MNWRQATLGQLYEIACNDIQAPLKYRLEAKAEIERRNKRFVIKHKRKQIRLVGGR